MSDEAESDQMLLEFAVNMTCEGCAKAVRGALEAVGAKVRSVDVPSQTVLVESKAGLTSAALKQTIERTGKLAVIRGMGAASSGDDQRGGGSFSAAVCQLFGDKGEIGVARLVQFLLIASCSVSSHEQLLIEATIDNVFVANQQNDPEVYLSVCELGDLSHGCDSCGDVFSLKEGNLDFNGDLGSCQLADNGRVEFQANIPGLSVWQLIGRSLVLRTKSPSEVRLACGIVARSSGLFGNPKEICACDGISLWQERQVPVAGNRRQNISQTAN